MKKALLLLTLLGLLPCSMHADNWANYRETLDVNGKGSLNNPIVISTPGQLAQLANLVNNGNSLDNKVIVLANDIDLTAYDSNVRREWTPIGDNASPFKGVFLGINPNQEGWEQREPYTIKGLFISKVNGRIGLFGTIKGFVGYLNIVGAEISSPSAAVSCGIVSGAVNDGTCTCYEDEATGKRFTVQGAVYAVRAEGKITARGRSTYTGGIVGNNGGHVVHSTAKATIYNNNYGYSGGIAGITSGGVIFDCAADIDLFTTNCATAAGGITSVLQSGSVEACTSTGTIHDHVLHAGGIVGRMEVKGYVRGCVSTATVDTWGGSMAGIVGTMTPGSEYSSGDPTGSKIESSVFAGHLVGATSPVGGICGSIDWDNKEERIVNTLVAGTRILRADYKTIVGSTKAEPVQALSNSYWDMSLYAGTSIAEYTGGEYTNPTTVQGLTTDKLTSGKSGDARLLENDESADFYFKFQSGYYPRLMANKEWSGYETMKNNDLSTDAGRKMFCYDDMYRENSVMMSTAWLAAVPATIPKGDTAYDLVTSVSHKEKTLNWAEEQRGISLKSAIAFPEDSPVIDIKESTATVLNDGTFIATMSLAPTKKLDATFCRPQPLMPTKKLFFNATPDQIWDGTTATKYAAGTGLAEDPFIIKNGAQLALAVTSNAEGQWFKQLCDINLNPAYPNNIPQFSVTGNVWVIPANGWKGVYNGDGHFVKRYFTKNYKEKVSLFGDVAATAQIHSVGMVEAFSYAGGSALLASNVDGKIYNCIVQGICQPQAISSSRDKKTWDINCSGGICITVGANNSGGVVEDCISAVMCNMIYSDFNPLVSFSDKNKGTIRNCLITTPVLYGDLNFSSNGITAEGKSYIKDCYWLKGYEPGNTGYTLEELTTELGKNERWQTTEAYFPMLKTFAESDMAKLIMLPVRTDLNYDEAGFDNYQLGFNRHLLFEPGGAVWTSESNNFIDADCDMGIITPLSASFSPEEYPSISTRIMIGINYLTATLGKFAYNIPLRTSSSSISPGVTFMDDNALQACLDAFNTDNDTEHLSLTELKAVTNEQTLTAFQTATARRIKRFPEFRLFKSVTKLTSQLNGLSQLEEVRMPYALKTIGSNAFDGCSNLKEITITSKVTNVEPHPFYGSAIETINVDPFNTEYCSRNNVLFTANNALVAYPNGRQDDEEITISGVVSSIEEGAFYKLPKLKKLFFDLDDYNRVIPELWEGGIETTDGSLIDVYVKDATFDQQVYNEMLEDYSWETYAQANRLHRYYPLKIDKDGLGSFYIGFDAELPESLTPYIVARARPDLNLAFLQPVSRQVPAESPVVVFANSKNSVGGDLQSPTIINLLPTAQPLEPWNMYENRLNGAGIDGMPVYQEDSSEGGVYTLQKDDDGNIGFYIHREEMVDPFHAFLPYNSIGDQLEQGVYFALAYGVSDENNLTYWACPDGQAIVSGYQGEGNENLVVPETITATVSAASSAETYSVTQIDEAFLRNNKTNVWSIDFTKNSLIKNVNVDRKKEKNPFYKMDKRTIVYLPEGRGFTAAEGEQNVVIGTKCQTLALTDGWGFQPPYDFTTQKATYDRVLSATQKADGTWTPKAFSVCLPYPVLFDMQFMLEKGMAIHELWHVDEHTGQFVFTNSTPNYLSPGYAYVVVVKEGSVRLDADINDPVWGMDIVWNEGALDVKAQPSKGQTVSFNGSNNEDELNLAGQWTGTFMPMSNAACSEKKTYIIQSDGYYRRVSNLTPAHRRVNLYPFRAFFLPDESLKLNGYKMVYEYHEEGDETDFDPTAFPTTDFEGDGDMPPYDDEVVVGILPVLRDSQLLTPHSSLLTPNYYDLQGRRLNGKPAKGMYIYKGKKINK